MQEPVISMGHSSTTALAIAMIKNESDLVEDFVRHNLAFVDLMVVIDNDSSDGTREILLALQAEGLPLLIFDDPIVGYFQSEKVTFVYRRVVPEFNPDYVFLLDADEFIVADTPDALRAELQSLPRGTQAQYFWRTYIPAPGETSSEDPLRTIRYRRRTEAPPYPKAIIVRSASQDQHIVIQQGAHGVQLDSGAPLTTHRLERASLAHFPVRSVEQLQGKVLVGWLAYLVRNHAQGQVPTQGFQWQILYDRIVRGDGLTSGDITREALGYAQPLQPQRTWPDDVVEDPVTPRYSGLRFQDLARTEALPKLAAACERLFAPSARYAFVPSRTGTRAPDEDVYLDLPPFRHLAELYHPRSVLDIGCGATGPLELYASMAVQRLVGTGRVVPDGQSDRPIRYVPTAPDQMMDLGETFDFVLCTEVIQRFPVDAEDLLLDNIVRHAHRFIVFAGADVGQPGAAQLNLRPISHWLDKFAQRGWSPDLLQTRITRSLATFSWFRRNLLVLTPGTEGYDSTRTSLVERAKAPANWNDQKPMTVTHPFALLGQA
jgi:hypothetical protein